MSVRAKHYGTLEYVLATDAIVADLWLATFRIDHAGDIRDDPGNDQTLSTIFPAGENGVTGRLIFELHYEVVDQEAIDVLVSELEDAIMSGGLVAAENANVGTQSE
jgi:hypothetical protein